jgi:hypothetical protein
MAALSATLAATYWIWQNESNTPEPKSVIGKGAAAPRKAVAAVSREAATTLNLEKLEQREFAWGSGELFASKSWVPPPAPPPPPPPPRAPKLPFTFLGRMVEQGKTVVFLNRAQETFTVSAGESFAGTYRVEEIGADTIVLIYLPLKERQSINIGALN